MSIARSRRLAEGAPRALRTLLQGVQVSCDKGQGDDLGELGDLHRALVTIVLRLSFLCHAEARELVSLAPSASPARLLESLRRDAESAPQLLPNRAEAWRGLVEGFAQIRVTHEGSSDPHLFGGTCQKLERLPIDDAAIHGVLTRLMCVEGDDGTSRMVDFRDIDVEHLGASYEAMMGFAVERLSEPSVILAAKRAGTLPVDVILGLVTLLSLSGEERVRHVTDRGIALSPSVTRRLCDARDDHELVRAFGRSSLVTRPLPSGALILKRTENRRRSGSHYTPRELSEKAVTMALEPLFHELGPVVTPARILELKICDPAMGSGAFLLAASRVLGERLTAAWERHGMPELPSGVSPRAHARKLVLRECLYGVDKDYVAVELCRLSLWLEAGASGQPFTLFDHALRHGDSLIDLELPHVNAMPEQAPPFCWETAFSKVFARKNAPGFDAIVGNPPWISYAGRAAQPLEPALKAHYEEHYEAFAGYRNLQGLFVERSAKLLRPGGRLGLVLPSSMSEQHGYGPTRLAHDKLCAVDDDLPDLGEDGFDGVVQPCMILLSTRRATAVLQKVPVPWPVERPDLDEVSRAIVAKMNRAPLPSHLFGERGFQTMADDAREMSPVPTTRHTMPFRAGSDVTPFRRRSPSLYADPARVPSRFRTPGHFDAVRVLVRQTARIPLAALSDGLPFRNSVLAAFEDASHPAEFLVAYLNSSPIRWLHYMRHRDARQGLPQVKIGHLRAIPAPPHPKLVTELARIGHLLSEANAGIDDIRQIEIDDLVSDAFDLSQEERARIRSWANQRSR